ncbi:MAG: chlorophyll synthase ChlG [Acetobacteraceae bacterium]|nr:chlorophyll synthase ChlG [Acetobacteraceae bacterium]MDW8398482.1 chlorophyll synthase ChlG [Acetobacteraceae bacterium]
MPDHAIALRRPDPSAVLELLKPVTWFAPVWAFLCGVVSSGEPVWERIGLVAAGVLLAGPMVCGMSQAVNDWFDRHVDAINEPNRPIPSGRIPGPWGLRIAIAWTVLSLGLAALLGAWAFAATVIGVALAWAYSAPPLRLKRNGWWGNAAVGFSYETLPWITGAAILSAGAPGWKVIVLAALYGAGAHGIMTLNDFKSIEGDRRMGVASLPVLLGPERAARLACAVMLAPQPVVAALLLAWGAPVAATVVALLIGAQLLLMRKLLTDPRRLAPWYNATGTSLYVLGMLAAAIAVGGVS